MDEYLGIEAILLKDLVPYMVKNAEDNAATISRNMGRTSGYLTSLMHRGTVPGLAALADIAQVTGYVVAIKGKGEEITVLPNIAYLSSKDTEDPWQDEKERLEAAQIKHVVAVPETGLPVTGLKGLASHLPAGISMKTLIDFGATGYAVRNGMVWVSADDGSLVASFPSAKN